MRLGPEVCDECGKIESVECDNPDCYAYGSLVCNEHHECEDMEGYYDDIRK